MAVYENLCIRSKNQLEKMGELGEIVNSMGKDGTKLMVPDEIPIVYQFKKGKNGETVGASDAQVIGKATNLRIDQETGDFVATISINPMKRLSNHFIGNIDNLVVGSSYALSPTQKKRSTPDQYCLVNLVVYDKLTTQATKVAERITNTMVQKTYHAPTEVYDVNPTVGEKLKGFVDNLNEELKDATDPSVTWKGGVEIGRKPDE